MTVNGVVKNGVVVLEDGVKLIEGTQVKVAIAPASSFQEPKRESWSEVLLRFAGTAKGNYPPDFARNHDHYIHGTPKRGESQ